MRIAVFGATGATGQEVVKQALQKGHHVTAIGRRPTAFPEAVLKHEAFNSVEGDIFSEASLAEHLRGVEAVLSSLGVPGITSPFKMLDFYLPSTKAIVGAMKIAGVKRLIAITSWYTDGNDPNMPMHISWIIRPVSLLFIGGQLGDMNRMEAYLDTEKEAIDFTCIRPPGLRKGPATEKQIVVAEGQVVPGKAWFIDRADVARFMLDIAASQAYVHKCVAVAV